MTISAKRLSRPRRTVVLTYDGAELLDIAGPVNVLTAASRLAPSDVGYSIELSAKRAGLVTTAGGVQLHAPRSLAGLRGPLDTLVVPGGFYPDAGLALVPTIRRLAAESRRVVAVCSGAFLLAEAGLLDGRRAVSHWAGCAALQSRYPSVRVEDDAIFVRDGKLWTSAGVTAGMDLALALVEQDLGAQVALQVARWLVMYLRRPGGQSQFSAPLAAQSAECAPIATLLAWVATNLRVDLSVTALARRVAMSERNFARVFTKETGLTPAAWVTRLRLDAARSQLELSTRSVKQVAAVSGFRSPETLYRAFQRSLKTTPLEYRARFHAS
jgi:transcriptional regulator GlxA family with amidase domain